MPASPNKALISGNPIYAALENEHANRNTSLTHSMLYHFCNNEYWYKLVNNVSPLFDRTTILSFRCNEKNRILHDHEELVKAIEQKNKKEDASISRLHMTRYTENIDMMKQSFPEYFK